MHRCFESSTFELAAASVSTRSVGSVDLGFFGKLGGSHCEDRKSVAFFFYQYELCLMHTACTVSKALLLDVSTGSRVNDVFLGFWAKKHFLIRVLVARGISRAVGSRGMSFHNPDVSIAIGQTGRKLLDFFRSALVSFGMVRSNSVACPIGVMHRARATRRNPKDPIM